LPCPWNTHASTSIGLSLLALQVRSSLLAWVLAWVSTAWLARSHGEAQAVGLRLPQARVRIGVTYKVIGRIPVRASRVGHPKETVLHFTEIFFAHARTSVSLVNTTCPIPCAPRPRYRCLKNQHLWRRRPVGNQFQKHQIRCSRTVPAAVLQGKGSRQRSMFHPGTSIAPTLCSSGPASLGAAPLEGAEGQQRASAPASRREHSGGHAHGGSLPCLRLSVARLRLVSSPLCLLAAPENPLQDMPLEGRAATDLP